jgi:CTP synthase
MVDKLRVQTNTVEIALVGKYIGLHDAYLSVAEALRHGGINNSAKINIHWIDSVTLTEENIADKLAGCDGILVPGGFGSRGIEGKILAARYAREHKIPYLGLCLGMQIAIIEFARNILGLSDADSSELNPITPHPVIDLMPDQVNVTDLGGTLRLGKYPCHLKPGSKAALAYGVPIISERHRHRYEVNNKFRVQLEQHGMVLCGTSPDNRIVEMIELADHPYFLACQFHPEFKSRPNRPHPLFHSFIEACVKEKQK